MCFTKHLLWLCVSLDFVEAEHLPLGPRTKSNKIFVKKTKQNKTTWKHLNKTCLYNRRVRGDGGDEKDDVGVETVEAEHLAFSHHQQPRQVRNHLLHSDGPLLQPASGHWHQAAVVQRAHLGRWKTTQTPISYVQLFFLRRLHSYRIWALEKSRYHQRVTCNHQWVTCKANIVLRWLHSDRIWAAKNHRRLCVHIFLPFTDTRQRLYRTHIWATADTYSKQKHIQKWYTLHMYFFSSNKNMSCCFFLNNYPHPHPNKNPKREKKN